MSDDVDEIHSAPHLKSKVWKSFGFFKKNGKLDKSQAVCKLCRATIKYTGSTTNLSNHLLRQHGGADSSEQDASAASTASTNSTDKSGQDKDKKIQEFFQPQFSHNSARSKAITASIARFIAKDLRRLSGHDKNNRAKV